VFLEDYLVYQSQIGTPTYDPWVCLAAMATRTNRIRLGSTVTPLPRRRVAKLAAEAVALDHLSGGRVTLGIGLGDAWDMALANLGERTDARIRAEMVDEGLEVLVGLWSGEQFTYDGRFYQVQDVTMLPRPLQSPRIPIWIGGQYPRAGPIARAARWDGSCLFISTRLCARCDCAARLDG
jgi:alkanesulfonate monooxygenase SsuD/methylene tetrahydromethanopterin reductase-like flavin-dependent oxidoreductase (luciferase family)